MPQIIMLGMSGLDADLLRVYGPSLPNLRRLMLESPFLDLRSTIPPEPVPAWSSVYTGLNPANHGLLDKMDCLERTIPDLQTLQAELFWEKAAHAGKRVCVLNPLLARMDRSIDGLVLSASDACTDHVAHTPASAFPALLDEPLIPPSSQLATFCATLCERTEQQVSVALEMLARDRWDLFFVQLDALDHIQHFLWRYSDPGDPMYPGKNEHANRILDFYRLFDQIVGRFRAAKESESVIAVVSSHGHERRCTYRLHVNEWLRSQNFLTLQDKTQPTGAIQSVWRTLLEGTLTRLLPWYEGRQRAGHSIDQQNTAAQLVELASASSSYAGIKINRDLLAHEERDYNLVREAILTGLEQLCVNGSPVVHWAKTREQCYQGRYLDRYPDILFALRNDFGVGRSLGSSLVSADLTHRLISGTHSANGVFLLQNWPEELEVYEDFQPPTVMDVAPTLLRLLDVECAGLDGQMLVQPRVVRQLI
ncbi:MAG: alkaline phosphatase family protein [Ktedonobacteraceae bacterium]